MCGTAGTRIHVVGFQRLHCSVFPGVRNSMSDLSCPAVDVDSISMSVFPSLGGGLSFSPCMPTVLVTPNHRFMAKGRCGEGRQAERLARGDQQPVKVNCPAGLSLLLFPCGLWCSWHDCSRLVFLPRTAWPTFLCLYVAFRAFTRWCDCGCGLEIECLLSTNGGPGFGS